MVQFYRDDGSLGIMLLVHIALYFWVTVTKSTLSARQFEFGSWEKSGRCKISESLGVLNF